MQEGRFDVATELNWDEFRLVQAIAESHSLVGAAESLGLNHSTVFRRLATLEAGVGVRLFERSRSGYQPTAAGEEMIEVATRMSDAIMEFERRVAGRDVKPTGLLRLTALFCAWIGGSAVAGATGTAVALFSKVPPLLAPAVAGICVGLGIYLAISLLAGLLFKTTGNHSGVIRLGFGLGGALCGIIYGLLLLWAGISLIRGLGVLGEMRVLQARHEGRALGTEQKALFLIKLKESLELGVTGRTLKDTDPLPTVFYDDLVKLSMVAGDPQSLERFFKFPQTLSLLSNPAIAAIVQDPSVQRAVDNRNILPLLENKNVMAALRDPDLIGLLRSFNLTAALDFALEPAARATHPPPAPASQHSPRRPSYGTTAPIRPSAQP